LTLIRIFCFRVFKRRAEETLEQGGTVRSDDNAEALRKRLESFEQQTSPLIDYYDKKKLLVRLDGMESIENVAQQINEALSSA
jgi:adenylate kinase